MHSHTRYAVVRTIDGHYMRHHKGFSYRRGNHAVFTDKGQHARLFTRRHDAEGSRLPGTEVVEVKVNLP